jgi:hypothetical protein
MQNDIGVIIRNADEVLFTARLGYYDLIGSNPTRRISGLRNLIMFSQAFIDVLLSLETSADKALFTTWNEEQQSVMKSDAVMSHFTKLRDEMLKKEGIPVFTSWSPKFSTSEISELGKSPVGAKGFFIGDKSTGSGWIIGLPDDHEGRYYVELPENIAQIEQLFSALPIARNGALKSKSIESLCSDYLDSLEKMLDSARKTFLLRQI